MGIKTNMKDLKPRRQVYKREITLLSHGFSAPEHFPQGKITVYPWDSEIDAFLVDRSRNPEGNVILDLLQKCCNMNGCPVDKFVFSEIHPILLLSRALQYGGTVSYESHCPHCHARSMENINIPDDLRPAGLKAEDYPGSDTITLPVCKDEMKIRPLLVADHKKLEARLPEDRALISDRVMQICLGIVEVGGGKPETLEEVAQWYAALDPVDCKFLEEQLTEQSPHLDTRIPHLCQTCSRKFYHILQFDQEFFRSRSGGQPNPTVPKGV